VTDLELVGKRIVPVAFETHCRTVVRSEFQEIDWTAKQKWIRKLHAKSDTPKNKRCFGCESEREYLAFEQDQEIRSL
jgi:hypothetical protein